MRLTRVNAVSASARTPEKAHSSATTPIATMLIAPCPCQGAPYLGVRRRALISSSSPVALRVAEPCEDLLLPAPHERRLLFVDVVVLEEV